MYIIGKTGAFTSLFFANSEEAPTCDQLEQLTGLHEHSKTVRIIDSVAAKWEEVAITLGFDAPALDRIKRDHTSDCKAACTSMFQKWLDMEHADIGESMSWRTLIQGLQDAEFSCLADDVSDVLTVDGDKASSTEIKPL